MSFSKVISIVGAGLLALTSFALAQNGAFPNYPIVGGSSYSCGSTNGVQTCTVPAGPTILTGNENIPANTNLSDGRSPQNVLVKPASLNALPLLFPTASATPTAISASNLDGGVVYNHTTTITTARISLPPGSGAVNGQQFAVSANRTITTLSVEATPGDSMAANSQPTVLTASTTVPQGYRFICHMATAGVCTWYRLQ